MNVEKFRIWLKEKKYKSGYIKSRVSNCKKVEKYEENLDKHYTDDKGQSLLKKLNYTIEDQKNRLETGHKIPIDGDVIKRSASFKRSVKLYMDYKGSNLEPDEIDNNFSDEKDLQDSMVSQINELFPEYKIFGENNEGVEYRIGRGRIDILLEKHNGDLLVIELKHIIAYYDVLGQILMYIGLLMEKFPERVIKGFIIAREMDDSLKYAIKTTDNIGLKTYKLKSELKLELNDE